MGWRSFQCQSRIGESGWDDTECEFLRTRSNHTGPKLDRLIQSLQTIKNQEFVYTLWGFPFPPVLYTLGRERERERERERGEEKRRIKGRKGDEKGDRGNKAGVEMFVGDEEFEIGVYYLFGTFQYGMTPNGITNLESMLCQTVMG
ncbi:unnamed protein product [Prunus armeniaca]|uniref:Uncharacterized protein n=1 Tax=Prunus armeniaca TaxID=36596 RepID=A0A6J5VHN0_PRUAR|nr:unnamed protein product [Prunus armeniaca]